ncbi:MAG: hypothetical protein OXR07_05240 [Nitrospira sp.]|nr:hypothetical protein [Nitrospira sp.]MDD9859176.1 hypothetical protein [Nitrospira sp.]
MVRERATFPETAFFFAVFFRVTFFLATLTALGRKADFPVWRLNDADDDVFCLLDECPEMPFEVFLIDFPAISRLPMSPTTGHVSLLLPSLARATGAKA